MDDDLIEEIIYLIDSKRGDVGRLNYILSMLQDERPLYTSDKKYLDSLISTYIEPSKRKYGQQQSVDELKKELARVKNKLDRYEKRGYKKAIGRKAIFFFVTFFFGWHAIVQILSEKFLHDMQHVNPYLFPLYQLNFAIPSNVTKIFEQYNLSLESIIVYIWGAMIFAWIIVGLVYLVRFIRSRYSPLIQ